MNYRLSVFQAVAEKLSFTKASQVLHISQPAVTKHIKLLEDDLGKALFHRSRKGISLTSAGAVLLRHARQVAQLDEDVLLKLRSSEAVMRGTLALGATSTLGQYLLPEWLVESRRRWPDLRLNVVIGNTEEIIEGVQEHKLALGLIEGRCRGAGLQAESLMDDAIVCVASARHPLTFKRSVPLAALKQELVIFREQGSGTRDIVELALKREGLDLRKLKVDLELSSSEAIKAVIAAGHGVSFLSRSVVRRELAQGTLRVVPFRQLSITRTLSAIYPRGPRPGGAVEAFLMLVGQAIRRTGRENGAITSGYDI